MYDKDDLIDYVKAEAYGDVKVPNGGERVKITLEEGSSAMDIYIPYEFNDCVRNKYKISVYDNNYKIKYTKDSTYGDITLEVNEKAVVTALGSQSLIFYIPYELKSSSKIYEKEDVNYDA